MSKFEIGDRVRVERQLDGKFRVVSGDWNNAVIVKADVEVHAQFDSSRFEIYSLRGAIVRITESGS